MLHHFDPFLLQISGDFGIRWYGLSYMIGFLLGYFLIKWLVQRQRAGMSVSQVADFVTYAAIGTLVGGRLGYCVFYSPDLFLQFKSSFPFWGVLAVNEGGMASHGGMIGLVVACYLYARKIGASPVYLYDLVSLAGPLGVFFGRIANFINGELVGRVAPESYALGVKFPQDILNWPSQDPARLNTLVEVAEKMGISRDQWLTWMDQYRTSSEARAQVNSALHQMVNQVQVDNVAVQNAIAPLLDLRYPSQLFEAFGEGLILFVVLFFFWRKARRPGVVGSVFLVLYAIARIIGEQFRMPDAHIGYQLFELTRGQWLSIAMLVIGLVCLFVYSRSGSLPIPGWGQGRSVKLHRRN